MAGNKSKRGGARPGAGRPKGFAALEAEAQRVYAAKVLKKEFAPIFQKAIKQAKDGDKAARDYVTEFAFGKPTQPISGPDGKDLFPNDADRATAANALKDL